VKRHPVVEAVARELLQPPGVLRGDVVAQLDDNAALRGVDQQRILWIGSGRQRLGHTRSGEQQSGHDGKPTKHMNSRF